MQHRGALKWVGITFKFDINVKVKVPVKVKIVGVQIESFNTSIVKVEY